MLRHFYADVCRRVGSSENPGATYELVNETALEAFRELEAEGGNVRENPRLPQIDARFLGARHDPSLRGTIGNFGAGSFRPGLFALGVLSGMVCEPYGFFALLSPELRSRVQRIALSGNALRRNELLQKLIRLPFRLPTFVPAFSEESAVGAAVCRSGYEHMDFLCRCTLCSRRRRPCCQQHRGRGHRLRGIASSLYALASSAA